LTVPPKASTKARIGVDVVQWRIPSSSDRGGSLGGRGTVSVGGPVMAQAYERLIVVSLLLLLLQMTIRS